MNRSGQLTREAFRLWLRTGRVQKPQVEYKFNGWHDAEDGKFTHVGGGRYFPPGSTPSLGRERLAMAERPRAKPKGTWQGGGFTGGGGGNFGGGGSSDPGWETLEERRAREKAAKVRGADSSERVRSRLTPGPRRQSQYVVRRGDTLFAIAQREKLTVAQMAAANDIANSDRVDAGATLLIPAKHPLKSDRVVVQVRELRFEIDESGRTRFVEATLGNTKEKRSKREQAAAGKPDRRVTDDGGHFIAPRFGGPKDAYNHFAQDANFNRGTYRALEDSWAKAQREGKSVRLTVDVTYPSASKRPDKLVVRWTVDGKRKKQIFGNEKGGTHDIGR